MACKNICRLCKRLVISQAATFTGGNLIINLPAGCFENCRKVCIIVAQNIPAATTINAPVLITIGTGTQLYPLIKCNCKQLLACGIRTRTRYCARVETTPTGGIFKLLGDTCCPENNLSSINGTAPAASASTPAKK